MHNLEVDCLTEDRLVSVDFLKLLADYSSPKQKKRNLIKY